MQEKNLNLIPSGDMPVIYASQYDKNRVIRFNLFEGEDEYTLTGTEIVKCNIRKNDEHIVVITPTIGANKYIDIYLTEQACTCFGRNIGEITISSDEDTLIGTINFILEVERNPIQGGVTSATDIDDLTSQIEEIVQEVMTDDYYTKTEVDAKLDLKANAADVYTKTQVDTALGLKADKSTTYTKTEVDTALALKADASSVYTKSEVDTALALKANAADVYTKTEVDEIIEGLYPVSTAGGSLANFTTSLALPLVAMSAEIVAQQAGSGTPTPNNQRAISGWDNINIYHEGNNFIDTSTLALRDVDANHNQRASYAPFLLSAGTYALHVTFSDSASQIYVQNANDYTVIANNNKDFTFTLNTATTVMVRTTYSTTSGAQSAISSIALRQRIDTKTIALGQTVYGGVLDAKNGKLIITHVCEELGSLTWGSGTGGVSRFVANPTYTAKTPTVATIQADVISDIFKTVSSRTIYDGVDDYEIAIHTNGTIWVRDTDYSDKDAFKTAMANHYVVYELATPQEITGLTPANFTTIAGEQNIFADSGDISVSFKQGIQEYIDSKVGG